MKSRRLFVAAVGVTVIAASPVAAASAAEGDKVTGGGQVFFSEDGNGTQPKGALNTVGVTAQETAEGVKGQVQFVDRSGSARRPVSTHYVVDCITVMGNQALIGGFERGGTPQQDRFTMYVEDNGEGAGDREEFGRDILTFDNTAVDDTCEFDDNDNDVEIQLARGNVQVHGSSPTDQGFSDSMAVAPVTALGLGL